MKIQYSYSNNKQFLSKIDNLKVQEQWVKITLLNYKDEHPIKNIEGQVVSGTLTKTGDSSVRRTCNLNCIVDAFKYDLNDIKSDYSISKKIFLELGVTNTTDEYVDEKIIWFPQGIFFITSFAISASSNGSATISLQFKDKMAQLDGTVGGILPATVRFDTMTDIVDGIVSTKKTLVYDIIMEAVNHFGGEPLPNIIIDDIPNKIKRIIKWMGNESLWIYPIQGNGKISYDVCLTSDLDEKQTAHTPIQYNGNIIGAKEYSSNQNIGYMYEDFVYDDELTFNAGSKVTDILDKIKNWLGNYEYFYDEQGQFHFQEIKNYLNNPQSTNIWNKIIHKTDDLDYLYESTKGKSIYLFDDNTNLISITNTPIYENIKNDFIVEGTINLDGIKRSCKYHLVIDDKPSISSEGYENILVYKDPSSNNTTITTPIILDNFDLPDIAESNKIYGLIDEPRMITVQQTLKGMDNFATTYDNFVETENDLIQEDSNVELNIKQKQYLITFLENYMKYNDNTPYKELYRDIIFTLARQLQNYNVSNVIFSENSTEEYYNTLYSQYKNDISLYEDRIGWCGGLLKLLYDIFENIGNSLDDSSDIIDINYWPAITKPVPQLWEGISSSINNETLLRNLRKAQCLQYINDVQIKQIELKILIEQYGQIINSYNTQLGIFDRKISLTDEEENLKKEIISDKAIIQSCIDNYNLQLSNCEQRLEILYAILTELGASDLGIGEIYYNIDIEISVLSTSFWYYDTSKGWKEIEWYDYYSDYTKNNIGSISFIDYTQVNWEKVNYNNTNNIPSMRYYSQWYQQSYIPYAEKYGLHYFKFESSRYIPNDWRTELFLQGLRAEANGIDPGYYYQELKLNWPSLFDLRTGELLASDFDYINYFAGYTGVMIGDEYEFDEINSNANANANTENNTVAQFIDDKKADITNFISNYDNTNYYYFFDMIDSSSPTWGEYSVNNIGRRTNVNVTESVNCIFAPVIPNYAFINISNLTLQERIKALSELADVAEEVIPITDTFYNNFATGSFKQSAYEQIKYDLQQHTTYQNTVSITARPCFYLEPNSRVTLNDHSTNTYGDYIIKSISIPLGIGSNMSVSLSKAMEKI